MCIILSNTGVILNIQYLVLELCVFMNALYIKASKKVLPELHYFIKNGQLFFS